MKLVVVTGLSGAGKSQALREIAEKRMDNPDMPLKELGEAFDPPISKSAVNHRLRKLMEFAAQWQTEQYEEK